MSKKKIISYFLRKITGNVKFTILKIINSFNKHDFYFITILKNNYKK